MADNNIQYEEILKQSVERWDSIAKPISSLGLLEKYVTKICAISGSPLPCDITKKALVIMCADNGVVEEGVTQTGKEVTRIVAENFAAGHSSVNYMSACAGVDVYSIDIGMDTDAYPEKQLTTNAIIDRKISRGTRNLARQPAMSRDECERAIDTGITIAGELKKKGYGIIATGEMGIGNTTPTTILGAHLLDMTAEQVTGRGAGLDNSGLSKKINVVKNTLDRIRTKIYNNKISDIIDIIAEAGSYEIAGMVGIFMGGVKYKIPVVMDGVISVISALAATRINPDVEKYSLPSHISEEPLAVYALKAMNQEAIIHAHMCLGEGTGAITLFPLLDMAMSVYSNMATFDNLKIPAYKKENK